MTIVGAIDDASGEVWARFENSESTWAYLRIMRQRSINKGLPLSIYSDRHTMFHSPKEASMHHLFSQTQLSVITLLYIVVEKF